MNNQNTPVITFTECEEQRNKYTFSYLATKNGLQIEANGYLSPYHSGRAIEHIATIDNITFVCEELHGIQCEEIEQGIQEEIMNAFIIK